MVYDAGHKIIFLLHSDIRVVDGNETSGNLEVYYDGEWRSVCDDYWTGNDANVACKHLGFLPFSKCIAVWLINREVSSALTQSQISIIIPVTCHRTNFPM